MNAIGKNKRPLCQKKKGKKGVKGIRGVAELYPNEKKRQFNITLTPTALLNLEKIANEINESRSQVIELTLRGDIDISSLLNLIKARYHD